MASLFPAEPPPADPTDRIGSEHQLDSLMSMVSGVQLPFADRLQHIVQSGLAALPAADGVGLAVLQDGRLSHLTATGDLVSRMDDAQYGLMEGPCVTAAREGSTVLAGSMADDRRWRRLRPEAERIGVQSALSIPLAVQDLVIGTLNLYARRRDAFDAAAAAAGERFAHPAAAALQQAQVLRRTRLLAEGLAAAVAVRRTVNRTIGLLMAQDGLEAAEAQAALAATAAARSADLGTVAAAVWEERIPLACLAPSTDTTSALRR